MPLYTFRCPQCKRTETGFRKIADRDHLPVCECAGEDRGIFPMARIVEAPAVQTDLPGYTSPIDGRWIEGRRARTEDLKRNGCRPWEGMETERKEAIKRAEAADAEFGKKIESGIAEVYNGMSTDSQRALQQL
ncbi:putative FmdB family regulatory protein [Burkholderia pyrrocinia]|uniref:Putative FmdB family regulatory protein n=2 Tax=Burkholderiaceae TaxID=119060 RepID=A0A318J360_BURPY|nr:putative FmdB family regulatory protein [Burkholderia pyrrocinia]SFW58167.1 putative regulatory protein, FmdB family [Burkholderia sp. NFACC33-1]SFY11334.1 putative regulatory protein, FmdB family [Burkholderia sp. NFPP32]